MNDQEILRREIVAAIANLPADQQALVQEIAETIRRMEKKYKAFARFAIALVGAELAMESVTDD